MVNHDGIDSKVKQGRLVYDNISTILGNGPRTVKLWVPKYQPYELTTPNATYTVMMDGWSPYTATNYGKYGTWDLNEIEKTTV